MGNIVGERFDDFVINQINARQSLAGKGFGEATLSPSDLLLLNNRNAWLKLASSVNVFNPTVNVKVENSYKQGFINAGVISQPTVTLPNGTNRLIDIGIGAGEAPSFLGPKFSQKAVLFNTLSEFTPTTYKKNEETGELTDQIDTLGSYNFRSGVSKSDSLWNSSNSYGLGGSNFGLTPAPGLISAKITCENRGSIRNAEVVIKAFNQFQFEMIELLYLRLGFTMMLEWGWDKYLNKEGKITNMGNTIIEDSWFNSSTTSQLSMLNKIQDKRGECAGNYDGFFGRVVNFDWNFNKNGSYDITLKLVTLGDVIESIKAKPSSNPVSLDGIKDLIENEINSKEKKRLTALEKSTLVTMAGSNPISQGLYVDIITPDLWNTKEKNYFTFNNIKELNTPPSYLANNTNTSGPDLQSGKIEYKDNTPQKSPDDSLYYMTFSEFLTRVQQYTIPTLGPNENNSQKQLFIDTNIDDNLCSAYPNQISFDPRICLINPKFSTSMRSDESTNVNRLSWENSLKSFHTVENDGKLLYGKIMNIYLNYKFISDCLSQNMDKDGNISLYKLITRICDGINSALGNLQQIEAVVRDEIYIVIQDQNQIPGLELKYPEKLAKTIAPFEIFGFNTVGSGSSNFVTDFNFNTKITPQLSSQIAIGTTANNISTKNYDGTAFSKWNSGLQDRYAAFYADPLPKLKTPKSRDLTPEQEEQEIEKWEKGDNVIDAGEFGGDIVGLKKNITSPSTGILFSYPISKIRYLQEVKTQYQANFDKAEAAANKETIENLYKNDYGFYLVRAFGGSSKLSNGTDLRKKESNEVLYYFMEGDFVEEGKSIFNNYIVTNNLNPYYNDSNTPANTIGYIPADLGLTFKGLSGIKIYQQLAVRQDFLPIQYSKALKFLIKGVNHSISNNDWSTNLSTLSVPNVKAALNLDGTPKYNNIFISDDLINEPTPNATELRNYLRGGISVISNNFFEKGNEISNNGDISVRLKDITIELLKSLNKAISQIPSPSKPIEIRITAGNDTSHSGSSSRHPEGNALDFTLGPPINPTWGAQLTTLKTYNINGKNIILPAGPIPKYPSSQYEYINLIDKAMMDFTKNNLGTNYINEYYNPSIGASGPHFHFSVRDNFVET